SDTYKLSHPRAAAGDPLGFEIPAEFKQESRHPHDNGRLQTPDDFQMAFDTGQTVSYGSSPELSHSGKVGKAGYEASVDRAGQKDSVIRSDPARGKGDLFIVGQPLEILLGIHDTGRKAGSARRKDDIHDSVHRHRKKIAVMLTEKLPVSEWNILERIHCH